MNAAAGPTIRRSARAAARDALIRIRATSSGPSSPEPNTDAPTANKPVKRRRTAKKQQQEEPEQGLAAEAAAEPAGAPSEVSGMEVAAEEAKPRRGPKKKTGAAAAAAAGPSREYEQELWAQGYANVAGGHLGREDLGAGAVIVNS